MYPQIHYNYLELRAGEAEKPGDEHNQRRRSIKIRDSLKGLY